MTRGTNMATASTVGVSDLLASAFSSTLGSTVVTYDQYRKREKKEKYTTFFQALDIDKLFNVSQVQGKFGELPIKHELPKVGEHPTQNAVSLHSSTSSSSGSPVPRPPPPKKRKEDCEPTASSADDSESEAEPFDIYIKTLSGKTLTVEVAPDDTVTDLKLKLQSVGEGHPDMLRLIFDQKQLEDARLLSEYSIRKETTVYLVLRLRGGGGPCTYYVDDSLLDPKFDYDFTSTIDNGTKFFRGGHEYQRPYGWKRYAIKVLGRFEDDYWLGKMGQRVRSSEGEWPVSYHGTGESVSGSIAQDGYKLSKGKRFRFGRGIYTTPSIEVAAKYAQKFERKSKTYKIVFQNRVCPNDLKIVAGKTTGIGEYWVQPNEKFVRPYGICVQQSD